MQAVKSEIGYEKYLFERCEKSVANLSSGFDIKN